MAGAGGASGQRDARRFQHQCRWLTLSLREGGLPIIEVHRKLAGLSGAVADAAYSLYVQDTRNSTARRFACATSRSTPAQVRQLDLATGEQVVLKETRCWAVRRRRLCQPRLWATAKDGTCADQSGGQARAGDHPTPLYLYGYGRVWRKPRPLVLPARLSLLDRGVAFAIAHVRGGGELGEPGIATVNRKTNRTRSMISSVAPST